MNNDQLVDVKTEQNVSKFNLFNTLDALQRIFEFLNRRLYNEELPTPVITVQTSGRKKGVLGWFSSARIWVSKDNSENNSNYEINITAEYLSREMHEIIGTMAHEMVHLYCAIHNIKDVSNNNVYHNKNFKKVAEDHGLKVTRSGSLGYSCTELKDEIKDDATSFSVDMRLNNLHDAFNYYRQKNVRLVANTVRSYTFLCGCRKKSIRSTNPNVHAICSDCGEKFFRKDGTEIEE